MVSGVLFYINRSCSIDWVVIGYYLLESEGSGNSFCQS